MHGLTSLPFYSDNSATTTNYGFIAFSVESKAKLHRYITPTIFDLNADRLEKGAKEYQGPTEKSTRNFNTLKSNPKSLNSALEN